MQNEFYERIKNHIDNEAEDKDKYAELAKIAPTEKARKILLDISKEEKRHREYLQEILNDCPVKSEPILSESGSSSEHNASHQIDYPDSIENVGVDEDVIKATDKKK